MRVASGPQGRVMRIPAGKATRSSRRNQRPTFARSVIRGRQIRELVRLFFFSALCRVVSFLRRVPPATDEERSLQRGHCYYSTGLADYDEAGS